MKKQSVMRLAFILWAGFIMQTASYAQDQPGLDMLMTSKAPYCETVALNCSEQYISFFREHNYDSCHIVLEYWESKCSMTEPLQRAIILLAIAEDRFSDDLYNENIINYTDNFSSRILYTSGGNQLAYFSQSKAYFGYIPIDAGFDRFTKEQAEHLSEETDKNSTAYLFCRLYAGDSKLFFTTVQSRQYHGSRLQQSYNREVAKYMRYPFMDFALLSGNWMPQGKLSLLGDHPTLGYIFGIKQRRFLFDMYQDFKFKQVNSQPFFTMGLGLDFGRQMVRSHRNEINIRGGLGYDMIFSNVDLYDNALMSSIKFIYFAGASVEYRRYYTNQAYLGVQIKYELMEFAFAKGFIPLGNALTLRLNLGFCSNYYVNWQLKRIFYRN